MTAADPTALREALATELCDCLRYDRHRGIIIGIGDAVDACLAGPLATLLDHLAKAEGERDEARAAIAEKAAGETLLTHMGPRGGGFVMELRDGPIPYIAEYLARVLGLGSDEPLSNYAQVEVHHHEIGEMVLTLQRHSGLTPAQKAANAEAERDTALAERDALQAQVARLEKRIKALEAGEQGDVCPFSKPSKAWAHIGVNDPCPVCGDLGTLASADKPSSCPDMQRSRPARAALKTQEAEHAQS